MPLESFCRMYCGKCKRETILHVCETCKEKTKQMHYCRECGIIEKKECPKHGYTTTYKNKEIDINHFFDLAVKKLDLKILPDVIKGVRGTSNKDHTPEHLAKGILRAEGRINGETIIANNVETAAKPSKIMLKYLMNEYINKSDIPPLKADGRDILVIKTDITDANNIIVPNAHNMVHFSIEGGGRILGVGNGNINSHEKSKTKNRTAYNGSCVAIIQSTLDAGEIILKAESDGLKSDEILINSKSPVPRSIVIYSNPYTIDMENGWSLLSAQIMDSYGTLIPSAKESITFKINGPGIFENADKFVTVKTVNGKANKKIFSTGKEGVIEVTAISENLRSGKVELNVKN